MARTLVIELPDDLEQQLTNQADILNKPLESVVLQTLTAVEALIQALQDENLDIRRSAAEALGRIGTASAATALARVSQANSTEFTDRPEFDPILPLIGTLHLSTTDIGEDHDRYIGEALLRKLRSSE